VHSLLTVTLVCDEDRLRNAFFMSLLPDSHLGLPGMALAKLCIPIFKTMFGMPQSPSSLIEVNKDTEKKSRGCCRLIDNLPNFTPDTHLFSMLISCHPITVCPSSDVS
jgi:hypothetical protein